MIAAHFGPGRFGSVMGWTYALTLAVAILAVRFVGFMFDRFAGYRLAFECFAIVLACLLATTLLFALGKRQPA